MNNFKPKIFLIDFDLNHLLNLKRCLERYAYVLPQNINCLKEIKTEKDFLTYVCTELKNVDQGFDAVILPTEGFWIDLKGVRYCGAEFITFIRKKLSSSIRLIFLSYDDIETLQLRSLENIRLKRYNDVEVIVKPLRIKKFCEMLEMRR